MSTFVGRREAVPGKPAANAEVGAEKTRAELVAEAKELGIEVPPKATKPQIQKLIDEAPVM